MCVCRWYCCIARHIDCGAVCGNGGPHGSPLVPATKVQEVERCIHDDCKGVEGVQAAMSRGELTRIVDSCVLFVACSQGMGDYWCAMTGAPSNVAVAHTCMHTSITHQACAVRPPPLPSHQKPPFPPFICCAASYFCFAWCGSSPWHGAEHACAAGSPWPTPRSLLLAPSAG